MQDEVNWWTSRITQGLRIIEECPTGYKDAARSFSRQARKANELLVTSVVCAALSFVAMNSVCCNFFICLLAASLAVALCFFAYGIIGTPHEIPSYKVSKIVQGSPQEVFRLLMNLERYHTWDEAAVSMRVVQELDDHADILHVVLRPILIWPIWQQSRDMVLTRYWRREEDGSYIIVYTSTTHPECRPLPDFIRARIDAAFVITPPKSAQAGRSLVTHTVRYDPRGYAGVLCKLGYGVNLVLPLLRRVVGIRDEINSLKFITPMYTTEEMTGDEATPSTSVDSSGLVLGVKKISSNLPTHNWAEPDASKFNIRGQHYLTNKKKEPAGPSGFHLVGVDLFAFEKAGDQYNIGSCSHSAVHQSTEFTFIINMILPGPENMAMAFYYHASRPNIFEENSPFSELLNDFLDGDDAFRNSRFKLIPTVVDGSFIIKQAVGSKPALIGNKLKCPYTKGSNYFEIDIDIASNSVANTVVGMVRGVTKSLVVDIAFLFESQSEEELPETILGTVRLQHVSLDDPVKISRN